MGDGSDQYKLVGRVKNKDVLDEMEAEHYMDSVLIGDSAYEVVTGFAGVPKVTAAAESQEQLTNIKGAIASQTGDEAEADDRELLARFLIDNL